jgi:hypothetical protein
MESEESEVSVFSIQPLDSDDDDAPMVQLYRRPERQVPQPPLPVRRVLQPPLPTDDDPEADDLSGDESSEPESIYSQHPVLTKFLKKSCADVDMLVMHQYDLQDLITHFPFNLISLENHIFRHRGFTERAESLVSGFGSHVIQQTALFIGTINSFQILLENITSERVDEVKAYFVTQLATDKSLYQGFVSSHVRRGVVSRKGCVISVSAFVKLCFGCGVHRISLGRFGQKTPWPEFAFFDRNVVPSCEKVSIDVAFNFPVPQNDQLQECIPLFCYARNPSRSSLMFHKLGQKLLYQKLVNWGWVRYDLPRYFQDTAAVRGTLPKNKVTAYPNFFHAVRNLTDFEFKEFPKTLRSKKIRVQKIRTLADELSDLLRSDSVPFVSAGRVEISLHGIDSKMDVMSDCKMIALNQFKRLHMKLVPIADILTELETLIDYPDPVGSDSTRLTPSDEAELAIISNMCGLWSFKFKKYLPQRLRYQEPEEDGEVPSEDATLFSKLSPEQKIEILTWYVGSHSRSTTKFTFRTWNSKGGLMRKVKGPPIPNGSFDSPEDAAEAILLLAQELEVDWISIPMLVRSGKARLLHEEGNLAP